MNTSSKSKIRSLFLNRKPQHKSKSNWTGGRKGPAQKKIEPWALGGVYAHTQLLKPDVTTIDPLVMSALPKTTVLPGDPANPAVATAAAPGDEDKKLNNIEEGKSKSEEENLKSDEAGEKQKSDENTGDGDGDGDQKKKKESRSGDDDLENKHKSDNHINNMATLSIDEVKRKRNRNEDSIDSITKFIDDDDTNDVLSKLPNVPKSNGNAPLSSNGKDSRKRRKSRKRRNKKDKFAKQNGCDGEYESDPEEERIVKCLYYSLKCCECTIS